MVAKEKEAKHHILCSYDPKFELFHSVQKHSHFWSRELNVAQINYFAWEMSALKRHFSDGRSAIHAYESHSEEWKAGFSAHLLISQKWASDRDAFSFSKSLGKIKKKFNHV